MYSLMMCALVQDEVALHQDGHLVVRVHQRDVLGLGEDVHIADLEVHALLEQHEAAAVRIGIRSFRSTAPSWRGALVEREENETTADQENQTRKAHNEVSF